MDRNLKTIVIVLIAVTFLTGSNAALATQGEKDSGETITVAFWGGEKKVDLSFEAVFDTPFYREGYFPWAILAATIVVAGVVSFATAGAGAPAAATGASTVASAVAGGGAGSYMAGLSTIGGWFGGNAMVGAAILNGLSLGLGGGGTAWASLSAIGKIAVVASVTATSLDGVLLFIDPTSKELSYRIVLPVPENVGTKETRAAVQEIADFQAAALKALRKDDQSGFCDAAQRREYAVEWTRVLAESATRSSSPEDLIVLATLRKNAGDSAQFQQLLESIAPSAVSNSGYLYYLKAILSIENGDLEQAERFLWSSWAASLYAIEPPILLVNLFGFRDFNSNEENILFIVERAAKRFDDGEYETPYSMLALYYRLATQYFIHERYAEAEKYYRLAYKEVPFLTKHFDYFGKKRIRPIVELGIANSLHGQGRVGDADSIVERLIKDSDSEEERDALRMQYVKHAASPDSGDARPPEKPVESQNLEPVC